MASEQGRPALERAWALLDPIYEAASREQRWPRALAALCDAMRGDPCAVIAVHLEDGGHGRIFAHGIDTSDIGPEERWFKTGPVESDPAQLPGEAVLHVERDDANLAGSPLFQMVLASRGVRGRVVERMEERLATREPAAVG